METFNIGRKVADSKKQAAPAYSFGSRHKNKSETYGPGPIYSIRGLASKGKDTPPGIPQK